MFERAAVRRLADKRKQFRRQPEKSRSSSFVRRWNRREHEGPTGCSALARLARGRAGRSGLREHRLATIRRIVA